MIRPPYCFHPPAPEPFSSSQLAVAGKSVGGVAAAGSVSGQGAAGQPQTAVWRRALQAVGVFAG